ncbi:MULTISPECIES: DMT family transporter [unclassified Janthinobacterium]|uniref:DMT family transporter n=1 Tax=unclassified Janthinobacterium TaxID=2610881 RepID=UPI000565BC23|nr:MULTISPECIES: DMT family transporter [unclassified Janthinobacterium]MEC5163067.1 drug/metabolite transporter (DMT)-like permease [Janthinobacterium sp. CG_S6]
MSHRRAVALVLLSAVGFGSMALFAKAAYASGVAPSTLLALRFVLAALMLAPVVWIKGLQLPRGRVLAGYIAMGCMYTAQSQSYFNALLHASSGLVGLLLYVYPVLVTALALAFGWEKLDRRMLVLMLVAVGGMAVTLGGELQGKPIGIALALLAAAIYAFYILLGNRLSRSRQDTHPMAACVVIMVTAAVNNTGLAMWNGVALPDGAGGWLAVAAIALFSTAMAVACFLSGVKEVGAAQASILSTLEPVVTLGLGVAMLHESVSASQLLGGALVLTAVVLLAQRPPARPAAGATGAREASALS